MVRIGIIGVGGFAASHWQALGEVQRSGACRLVAAVVRRPDRYAARVEELRGGDVEVFASADEMIDAMRGRMDAVTIPTPTHTHAELAVRALRGGYHVLIERPAAATVQEVDEILAAARRNSRLLAVAFGDLWRPSLGLLKTRHGEGALGRVQRIACAAGWTRPERSFADRPWAGRLRLGEAWVLDGTLNGAFANRLAAMLYLASPVPRKLAAPAAVRAELYAAHRIESEDTAAVEVFTGDGPRCYLLATLCADDRVDPEITILASDATVHCDCQGRVRIRYADGRTEEAGGDDGRHDVAMFENFIAAVAAGDASRLRCPLEIARPFTLAVNGAFESARLIRPIGPEHLLAGDRTVVAGIDAALSEAASQGCLFSDLQLPWAVGSGTFDMTGYGSFPQQFQPGEPVEPPRTGQLPFG